MIWAALSRPKALPLRLGRQRGLPTLRCFIQRSSSETTTLGIVKYRAETRSRYTRCSRLGSPLD
jgi:hypothetical protein